MQSVTEPPRCRFGALGDSLLLCDGWMVHMVYVSHVLLLQHSLTCVTFYQGGFGSRFLCSVVACDDAGALSCRIRRWNTEKNTERKASEGKQLVLLCLNSVCHDGMLRRFLNLRMPEMMRKKNDPTPSIHVSVFKPRSSSLPPPDDDISMRFVSSASLLSDLESRCPSPPCPGVSAFPIA